MEKEFEEGNPIEDGFKWNCQRGLFTYKHHLDKKLLIDFFTKISKTKIINIEIAHETGDAKCNYNHTHVVVNWEKRFMITKSSSWNYVHEGESIHPHVRTLSGEKAFKDALGYISKEDPSCEHLKCFRGTDNTVPNIWNKVQNCQTINDAMEKCVTKPSDALGIKLMFDLQKKDILFNDIDPPSHIWQLKLLKEVVPEEGKQPEKRKIIWYTDEIGGCAKSEFARYLMATYPNQWYVTKDLGTARDCASIIANAINGGWEAWGIIIDLPRSAENHTRVYGYIEEIKDGFVTVTKYSGKTLMFRRPWVIVMSNWYPTIGALSEDRWDIRCLNKHDNQITVNTLSKEDISVLKMSQKLKSKGSIEQGGLTLKDAPPV